MQATSLFRRAWVLLAVSGCAEPSWLDGPAHPQLSDGAVALDADGGSASPSGASSAELKEGAALYAMHCASCHGDAGQGTAFGLPLTRDMGLEMLTSRIDRDMPAGNAAACTGECARLVALYVQDTFVRGTGGGATLCEGEAPAPRQLRLLTRREYENTVQDLLGITPEDTSSLPVEGRVEGFDNHAKSAVVTSRHADGYMQLGKTLAERVMRENPGVLGCSHLDCRESLVTQFGKRAFRRPLQPSEVERYLALFDEDLTGGSFEAGATLMIRAMLASPHFLYRSEVGEPQGSEGYALTPYETASALSYLFWGSMPDATLFAAADANALSTPAELREQAQRLVADPRARPQIADFATQWLRTDGVLGANKDAAIYPNYSDAVRQAQMAEQAALFDHLFFDAEGTLKDLYLADYSFVNSPLSAFYGLSDPGSGDQLTRVSLPSDSARGGILTLGAVLAAHAHQNESSPIRRGLFVRERLLCQHLPDPPANLDTTPPGLDPTLTTRERFAVHTSADACSSCHKFIDGVGFGFEGFDGVGARRTVENGLAVDESGEVRGLEDLTFDTEQAFEGPAQLAAMLAESEAAQRCVATQYFRYATGRSTTGADACNAEALADAFIEDGLNLPALMLHVTQLESFVARKDANP